MELSKKESLYFPVLADHIQLLHYDSCHWFLSFSSSGRVQVCDNLYTNPALVSKTCLKSLYQPFIKNGNLDAFFLRVQKQTDSINPGLFALAFTSVLLDGKSPIDASFVVIRMLNHLVKCLTEACLCSEAYLRSLSDIDKFGNAPKFFGF